MKPAQSNNIKTLHARLPFWIKRHADLPDDYSELGKKFNESHSRPCKANWDTVEVEDGNIHDEMLRCTLWQYMRTTLPEIAEENIEPYMDLTTHTGILKAILVRSEAPKNTTTRDIIHAIWSEYEVGFIEGDALVRRIWDPIIPGIREILGFGREIQRYQWPLRFISAIHTRQQALQG